MDLDVKGIRIHPSALKFTDVEAGKVYNIQVSVKNISRETKTVRFYPPQSKDFKLRVKEHEKTIASGLDHVALVELKTSKEVGLKDRLVVTVDGDVIEVPVTVRPCEPVLEMEREVNFGHMVMANRVVTRQLYLMNHGSRPGEFKIQYSGKRPLNIVPPHGHVPPKTAQVLRVEYVTKELHEFDEHATVHLQGQESFQARIHGKIVRRSLELLASETEEQTIECVKFPATYYSTDSVRTAVLYNKSPEPINFVTILEEDAVGQEAGTSQEGQSSLVDTKECTNPLTSLVTMIPNQGALGPYEKTLVVFRFSPRWKAPRQAFKDTLDSPPRQDFSLFMHVQMVGGGEGSEGDSESSTQLEVAVTGTALPVLLDVGAQRETDFGLCTESRPAERQFCLTNRSSLLPVYFCFRRVAHFSAMPDKGSIRPGKALTVVVTFHPRQYGTFNVKQPIDVLGVIGHDINPFVERQEVIHTETLIFTGSCDSETKMPVAKFNPGIVPLITNEVGLNVDSRFSSTEKKPRQGLVTIEGASAGGPVGTRLFLSEEALNNPFKTRTAFIAFPNDRATSIRPSEKGKEFRTVLKRIPRYRYTDADYAYSDDEDLRVRHHKEGYTSMLRERHEARRVRKRDRKLEPFENSLDMGMAPGGGVAAHKLTQKDIRPTTPPPPFPNQTYKVLSTKELSELKQEVSKHNQSQGACNAMPTTEEEKKDCSTALTPQELHQIVIGPATVDFGRVCLRSLSMKELHVINNLDRHIHLQVEIDCRELRQSSPLSQVVLPRTKAVVPLIFESNVKGRFQRNINYVINGYYRDHVIALAEVVPVDLELSTHDLEVHPSPGQPAEAGIRGVITLRNVLNYPAEFNWEPIFKTNGTAFSIRPQSGSVDAFSNLDCEVVFHPSYNAPDDGEFILEVHGGKERRLRCVARLGSTHVAFLNKRIMFGHVPLQLGTVRTAILKNSSQNHAYYRVIDSKPYPGVTISPLHGVVPVGGEAKLKVTLTPSAVCKFDCSARVAIRGWKELELRIGGTVTIPSVDIVQKNFNFGGVFVGSTAIQEFELVNKTATRTKIEFDLTRFGDFTLSFPGNESPEDMSHTAMYPGVYTVTIRGEDSIKCLLHFTPTEVAAYDFCLPVTINTMKAPTPTATPIPPTPAIIPKEGTMAASKLSPWVGTKDPDPVKFPRAARDQMKESAPRSASSRPQVMTPRRHVTATAIRQPLQLSHKEIDFCLPPEYLEGQPQNTMKVVILVNNSDRSLPWALDTTIPEAAHFQILQEDGSPHDVDEEGRVAGVLETSGQVHRLGLLFTPTKPGKFSARLPLHVDNNPDRPFDHLTLTGEMKWPRLTFDPPFLVLTPVPLRSEVTVRFRILATDYPRPTHLEAVCPSVETEDGAPVKPLRISFIDKPDIFPPRAGSNPCNDRLVELRCRLSFCCDRPISFSAPVRFQDQLGNSADLVVTATSDNCVYSWYPFIAKHRDDYHIVCEEGKVLEGCDPIPNVEMGEAQLVPLGSGQTANSRPSTTATSSNFEASTSTYEDTLSGSESPYVPTPREGAVNKPRSKVTSQPTRASWDGAPLNELPNGSASEAGRSGGYRYNASEVSGTESDYHLEGEGAYHQEVLSAVQRWFTVQGWPGGHFPIFVPESLRSGLSRKSGGDEEERKMKDKAGGAWDSSGAKTEQKTIYDMITHLCGRPTPGIPISSTIPSEPTERVKQIYWQHQTLLTFLRSQGACLSHVKPEHLLEPKDYRHWLSVGCPGATGPTPVAKETRSIEEAVWQGELFEGISRRAWTDVLLQILKALILYRVTLRSFRQLPQPDPGLPLPNLSPDPLASNCYTLNERILLAWLNHFYEHYRNRVWRKCRTGVPPARWVINFDYDLLDGLVLGAVLGAHMPFLIDTHLADMYTHPNSPEQCLHNALKVVNAMRFAGLDFDIQALDITDPHPVMLLMLTVYLYETLHQYIPKATVDFVCTLHEPSIRQVTLNNPSPKAVSYHCKIAGKDARDFVLPRGDTVSVASKGSVSVPVQFCSRFLRPAEAVLMMVGRRTGGSTGATVLFTIHSQITAINPVSKEKVSAPCYELTALNLPVTNPFNEGGTFRVVLVESESDLLLTTNTALGSKLTQTKKKKKVTSKINNGRHKTEGEEDEVPKEKEEVVTSKQPAFKRKNEPLADPATSSLLSFFCHVTSIKLAPHKSASLPVTFLPFQVGHKQCSVVLVNEAVGEFLVAIEATAEPPVTTPVPYEQEVESKGARITSAIAASRGQKGDDNVVYWRCELGRRLEEVLKVPITNRQKDRALLLAAQEHLSDKEVKRRRVTGTLDSGTLVDKALEMLSVKTGKAKTKVSPEKKYDKKGDQIRFRVEVDSTYFTVPEFITLPDPKRVKSDSITGGEPLVSIPVSFNAKTAGLYPCNVILKGPDDVRVHRIECMVVPEGSSAELQFESPLHQPVVQSIPIVNQTPFDWPLTAQIQGSGFTGPEYMLAKAYTTTHYPLKFRPMQEGENEAKLLLINKTDGTEHVYHLRGIGRKPLALDTLRFDCQVKESLARTVLVPNVTHRKLVYAVESDLPFVVGREEVTVLPGRQMEYQVIARPNRRGEFNGILAFVAGKKKIVDYDSDGDELPAIDELPEGSSYRVWYRLEMTIQPAPPQRTLELACPCQKSALLTVPLTNPSADHRVTFEVVIEGESLIGETQVELEPGEKRNYEVSFMPAVVGDFSGSLIFFSEATGEFWFRLSLKALPPALTELDPVECELGKWQLIEIELRNPSPFCLELFPEVSNPRNFALQLAHEEGGIALEPHSTMLAPVRFTPSDLGNADHQCRINFKCDRLGDWVFKLSGVGRLPKPRDPVCVTTEAGSNATLLVPFHNPLSQPVIVDVHLVDASQKALQQLMVDGGGAKQDGHPEVFKLLLKKESNIRLGPKTSMEMPISFAPDEMREYDALLTVAMRKKDGTGWTDVPKDPFDVTQPLEDTELAAIRWLYPIKGIPELSAVEARGPGGTVMSAAPLIQGPARAVIEERLELWLAAVAPAPNPPQAGPIRRRQKTPGSAEGDQSSHRLPGEELLGAVGDEDEGSFSFEVKPKQEKEGRLLEDALRLHLLRQHRDPITGMMVLTFAVTFRPNRTFRCEAELLVRSSAGGVWRYPVKFLATEPDLDDVIEIRAAGLNKEASVQFRLNSQDREAAEFRAFFEEGSDPDFTITPDSGTLPPVGVSGLPFRITFQPAFYGKPKQARLVVQTSDMEWSYLLIGDLPEYSPPRGISNHPIAGPHPDLRQHRRPHNYVRQNMKLLCTAQSSPVKGASILPKL